MTSHLSHDELRDLLGPYALDALEPDEAVAVDRHLAVCTICPADLRDLTEVAGLLGAVDVEPPPEIWHNISSQLGSASPAPLQRLSVPRVLPARRWAMLSAAAVIILVAGLVSLGAVSLRQQHKLDRSNRALAAGNVQQSLQHAALAAAAAPGSRQVALVDARGAKLATVALLPGSTAYLVPASMQRLDVARTYQLWGMDGTTPISLAVLGAAPEVTPIQVPPGVNQLAVTVEPAPGSVAPTSHEVAAANVP